MSEVTDLGVVFDPVLRFYSHVAQILKSSLRTLIAECRAAEEFKTPTAFLALFSANTRSFLEYVVYRPTNNDIASFFKILEHLLHFANDAKCRLVLGGDLNIDILEQRNCSVEFLLHLSTYVFHNVIPFPTSITSSSSAFLDVSITSCNGSDITAGVLVSDISEHLPIYAFLKSHEIK